jgi:hypothetical protein
MRTRFILAGLLFCFVGGGIVFYQISESCEDSALANVYAGYPWCSNILEHINLTFLGVLALIVGIIILVLGSSLHWILEPSAPDTID